MLPFYYQGDTRTVSFFLNLFHPIFISDLKKWQPSQPFWLQPVYATYNKLPGGGNSNIFYFHP